jgi:peptidoglycan/LPS O-acetylase OafA/YrhL
MKHGYRADIDGLRAVAVLSVLLVHLNIAGFSGGFVGVDVFFVISGYLITRLIWAELKVGQFSFLNFYERRTRRIIPSLLATLLVSFIGAGLLFSPEDLLAYIRSLMSALLFVSNIYFWQEIGYFTSEIDIKPLIHTWSLSVEEQFYFIWPLLMVGLVRIKRPWIAYLLVAIIALLSLAAAQTMVFIDTNAAFYLLPFRIFEFCIGGALVWIYSTNITRKWLLEPLPIIGLAMIGYAVMTFTSKTPFPSFYTLIPCVGAALIIFAGGATRTAWLLANPLMRAIGLISYQLYLVHWPLIVYFSYASLNAIDTAQKGIILALTLVLSVLMYYLIDKPCRIVKTRESLLNFAIGCAGVMAVIAVLIFTVRLDMGWQWRIDEKYRVLIARPLKFHEENYGGVGMPSEVVSSLGAANIAPSFIFIGDSFAAQYGHGLREMLTPANRSAQILFDHGCLMLPGLTTFTFNALDVSCQAELPRIEQLIKDNNLPIVVAQSWLTYYEQLGDASGTPLRFENYDNYYQALIDGIDRLRQMMGDQRKLVVIGLTPGIREQKSLARCFKVPHIITNGCAEHVSVNQEEVLYGLVVNQKLMEYAKQHPNVTILNPYDALCKDGQCMAIQAGKLYYSDTSHLSLDGSKFVVDFYKDIFLSLTNVPTAATPSVPDLPSGQ